ncbi:metal ABC transporter substrate-binding protein [Sandaracinus amylolyticus]|uniref:metal ABC transporter substrate-binding protein n=1 Tax=Sandaracinus amylolyticus TaxID=927083 RepID=UPI001F30213B|nr:metal ABC transporter substrate-binding protein [Sandaracinus amylolyticus]UJR81905.1 Zinc ABC transporter, periplasmic-binding protein ZnuA [Sandaracinus amylolyticus]
MRVRVGRFVSAIVIAVLAIACGSGGGQQSGGGRPRVAVSIFPLYDVARRVAGDRLDVVCVLPPGRSEHGYDPTPREVARVTDARLAVLVGLEMDEWAERIVRGASDAEPEMLELGPRLEPRRLTAHEVGDELDEHEEEGHHDEEEHHHHHGALDPHFWLDPVRMRRAVPILVEAFSRIDAEGAAGFRERGAQVEAELGRLHDEIDARARTWSRRTIVTFHGSFGYYAERYGLRIAAVIEPFPGREPTPRYMQDVLTAIRESGAAALFSEPQLDPRPARVVAQQANVPLFELDPIGGGGSSTSYEALLRANTDVLERALR